MIEWLAIIGAIAVVAHAYRAGRDARAAWKRRKSALERESAAHAETKALLVAANAEIARLRVDADPAVQAVRWSANRKGRPS